VWNSSPTAGHAYLVNFTANVKVSIAFSAPAGTTLQGNSVEWIVERPEVNSGLATLTNYVAMATSIDTAWDYKAATPSYYYPGNAPTGTVYAITMLDESGLPISYPSASGSPDVCVYDKGSAR
jgi:hypothetical protein